MWLVSRVAVGWPLAVSQRHARARRRRARWWPVGHRQGRRRSWIRGCGWCRGCPWGDRWRHPRDTPAHRRVPMVASWAPSWENTIRATPWGWAVARVAVGCRAVAVHTRTRARSPRSVVACWVPSMVAESRRHRLCGTWIRRWWDPINELVRLRRYTVRRWWLFGCRPGRRRSVIRLPSERCRGWRWVGRWRDPIVALVGRQRCRGDPAAGRGQSAAIGGEDDLTYAIGVAGVEGGHGSPCGWLPHLHQSLLDLDIGIAADCGQSGAIRGEHDLTTPSEWPVSRVAIGDHRQVPEAHSSIVAVAGGSPVVASRVPWGRRRSALRRGYGPCRGRRRVDPVEGSHRRTSSLEPPFPVPVVASRVPSGENSI